MKNGKIVQVMGPVVDVEFPDNDLPYIKDALEVDNHGKKCVMEVAQHVGNNTVRCIMLSASEGLSRDMEVVATGSGIKVPVGNQTLGRLFNVLGETIDGKEDLSDTEHWVIHRQKYPANLRHHRIEPMQKINRVRQKIPRLRQHRKSQEGRMILRVLPDFVNFRLQMPRSHRNFSHRFESTADL